jgi:hypothetical protein
MGEKCTMAPSNGPIHGKMDDGNGPTAQLMKKMHDGNNSNYFFIYNFKKYFFYFKLFFLIFSYHFNMLMSKIIFKK